MVDVNSLFIILGVFILLTVRDIDSYITFEKLKFWQCLNICYC